MGASALGCVPPSIKPSLNLLQIKPLRSPLPQPIPKLLWILPVDILPGLRKLNHPRIARRPPAILRRRGALPGEQLALEVFGAGMRADKGNFMHPVVAKIIDVVALALARIAAKIALKRDLRGVWRGAAIPTLIRRPGNRLTADVQAQKLPQMLVFPPKPLLNHAVQIRKAQVGAQQKTSPDA